MKANKTKNRFVMPDDDQMCCLKCGHISEIKEPYATEYPDGKGGEKFPICPVCGGWNIGGYDTYAEWGILSDDHQEWIKVLNLKA